MSKLKGAAEAVADAAKGEILAHVEIAAPPERVFQALASSEVCDWWVRPGVFNTTEWNGDVRVGGRYRTVGIARGEPYAIEGEFLEIDPPRKLVMTWHRAGTPGKPTVITYVLNNFDGGTRLTLHHTGLPSAETSTNVSAGWKTSFEKLAEVLSNQAMGSKMQHEDETCRVVEAYFSAWTSNRLEDAYKTLAEDLEFAGPTARYSSAAEFRPALFGFAAMTRAARTVELVTQGATAALLYDCDLPDPVGTLRIASFFRVRDGKICWYETYFDATELRKILPGRT